MLRDGNRAGDAVGDSAVAVDELVELRDSVEEWARKAAEAVLCFQQENGSFWKDTTAIRSDEDDDTERSNKRNPGSILAPGKDGAVLAPELILRPSDW